MPLIEILIGLVAFFFLFCFFGIRMVPQGSRWIVERLGKYHRSIEPGLNIIIPVFDKVAYKLTTKDIVLDVENQSVISKDNAVIETSAVAYINITAPDKAVYGVENYETAIKTLIQTTLRSLIGQMSLDETLSSREKIKTELKNSVSADLAVWGISLKLIEIQDVTPSPSMIEAMQSQAASERRRRSTVTEAEGLKEAQILEAEGKLEASRREAEAQIILADASKVAIEKVTASIGDNELPVMYLLGERYIQSVENLAKSENTKTFVYPADLTGAIRQILHK